MTAMETVCIDNLTIGYTSRHNRKVVAEHLTASLSSACMTCLIGPNGVGKSTLLRTLSAFQPPLEGKVHIHGEDLSTLSEKQVARLIGVVLTARPDVQNMTVREMVGLGRSPYTGFWGTLSATDHAIVDEAIFHFGQHVEHHALLCLDVTEKIVDEAIALVGIEELSGRMIQTLSDGERQKVMIAKALAQQTPVIFLDEPTAFLDYPSKVEMMQMLHRLSRIADKTVFLSTHDLELALQIADSVWLMQRQGELRIGTPRQLADEGVLSAFIERKGIVFDRKRLTVRVIADENAEAEA